MFHFDQPVWPSRLLCGSPPFLGSPGEIPQHRPPSSSFTCQAMAWTQSSHGPAVLAQACAARPCLSCHLVTSPVEDGKKAGRLAHHIYVYASIRVIMAMIVWTEKRQNHREIERDRPRDREKRLARASDDASVRDWGPKKKKKTRLLGQTNSVLWAAGNVHKAPRTRLRLFSQLHTIHRPSVEQPRKHERRQKGVQPHNVARTARPHSGNGAQAAQGVHVAA